MPGDVKSMRMKVIPSCFLGPLVVRTRANIQFASRAWVVQILEPLRTKSSPSATADICNEARSDPDSGSLYP
ncbi:Uncharacterised protein [Mycobacteroides abscessus subsp. abscessus]|nr:Uncharacterised protein [Mycobacteroides abscessus subsp. abscessus]